MEFHEHNVDDDCLGETGVNDIMSPLLDRDAQNHLRQRGTRLVDVEEGSVASADGSRILDRSGAFRQSRGQWSVHRQSWHSQNGRCCRGCFQGRIWNEWNRGGWFHRLAYQRTSTLMLILFLAYTSIVVFFAGIYLLVSVVGQTTESNSDGSEKYVSFCHMEINNRMEALYMSLSTMASIGYGGEWIWVESLAESA